VISIYRYCSAIERKQGGVVSEATAGFRLDSVLEGLPPGRESFRLEKGSNPPWIRHLKKTIPRGPELKKNIRLVTAVKYEQAVIRGQRSGAMVQGPEAGIIFYFKALRSPLPCVLAGLFYSYLNLISYHHKGFLSLPFRAICFASLLSMGKKLHVFLSSLAS